MLFTGIHIPSNRFRVRGIPYPFHPTHGHSPDVQTQVIPFGRTDHLLDHTVGEPNPRENWSQGRILCNDAEQEKEPGEGEE